jgi:hypothetical protein
LDQFNQDGYLIIRGMFSCDEIDAVQQIAIAGTERHCPNVSYFSYRSTCEIQSSHLRSIYDVRGNVERDGARIR